MRSIRANSIYNANFKHKHIAFKYSVFSLLLIQCLSTYAQTPSPIQTDNQRQLLERVQIEQRQREQQEQQRRQQQQEQEQRARTISEPAQQTLPAIPTTTSDDVCFKITHINWNSAQSTIQPPWYLKHIANNALRTNPSTPDGTSAYPLGITDPLAANCLGQAEIIALEKTLSNALIEHGHITSKLNFPPQNIASGRLTIDWYPGIVGQISHNSQGGTPIGSLSMLFPNRTGELYNQRHADQALENLKRLPSQGNASIELQPGETAGISNIVYTLEKQPFYKRIHGTVGIDNAGGDSTGQYQGNASLSIDSPLHLNDLLTINYNRNADVNNNQHNTKSYGAYWDIDTGYGTFGLGYTQSSYLQTLPGFVSDLAYEGNSKDFYANVGWMLYRNSNSKTQANFKIGRKISHNFIDNTEIPIQLRDYVYTDAGLNHIHYHKDQQYSIGFNIRQSLPSHSKANGFIFGESNWNGKWRTYNLNASATVPFKINNSHWRYNGTLKLQKSKRPTPVSELFSLGSRYTVRGFDESFTLSAEDGMLVRNEISYLYGANQRQQVYLGLDWGKIEGPAANDAIATTLAGTALGVRGNYHNINYDLALGLPLNSPEYYDGKHQVSIYGTLSYQF